ncbi:MAG: PilZ domain-containing protein [Terriglobales bacterium]
MDDCAPNSNVMPPLPRRFQRYPADMRVSVEVFRPGGSVSLWGRSTELGEDGIGVTLTGEVEPGEVVSMELCLPAAATPLLVRALARYRDGLRHGFEFLALNQQQHELLHRACVVLENDE